MAEQEHTRATDLHYGHPRMSLADRAKIFIPFDPLKGFREALAEQERLALQAQEKPLDPEPDRWD